MRRVFLGAILALAIILTPRIFLYHYNKYFIWDECVYLQLAEKIARNPLNYYIAGIPQGYRPPLIPYLFSVFKLLGAGEALLLFSWLLTAASFYLISTLYFERRFYALISTIIGATIPNIVVFSSRYLNSALATSLAIISAYLILRGRKPLIAGVSAGLAFLARYTTPPIPGIALISKIVLRRDDIDAGYVAKLSLGALLPLFPWMITSWSLYGNPIGSFLNAFNQVYHEFPVPILEFVKLCLIYSSPLVILLAIGGLILSMRRRAEDTFLILYPIFYATFFVIVLSHREPRYLIEISPALGILSTRVLERLGSEKLVYPALALILLVSGYFTYTIGMAWATTYASQAESAIFIDRNLPENARIYTNALPIVVYFTDSENCEYIHQARRIERGSYIHLWRKDIDYLRSLGIDPDALRLVYRSRDGRALVFEVMRNCSLRKR